MESNEFEKAKPFNYNDSVGYADGGIVSKTVIKREAGNISLFSFAKGEGLTEHTSPFDAVVEVVDGKCEITIGGKPVIVQKGETIIMPANVPHALKAIERFKMALIMIRST